MDKEKDGNNEQLNEDKNNHKDVDSEEREVTELESCNNVSVTGKVKNSKRIILIGSAIIILLILAVTLTVSSYKNLVYPGATVCGIDLSKLDKNELEKELKGIVSKIDKNEINIDAKSEIYDVKVSDLVEGYNLEVIKKEIMNYGKDKNIIEQFMMILKKDKINYSFNLIIDENKVKGIIENIENETNHPCEEPRVSINGENIKYEHGKSGMKLNKKDLKTQISNFSSNINDLNKDIVISAKYEEDIPTIDINDLKLIDTKISTYSTTYGVGGGRGSNVENAVSKIDDILLMPGEEFSYEKAVGPVEINNGYTYAPVIVNGELQSGVGGGVCQVSSTLYNTTLKAGIVPTERRNHSKPVNYVPRGLDATLASGSIDYKFKNTYSYPLVLNSSTSGGKITIEIWSSKDATKGINYEPKSYSSGNVANTYLYGYDKEGKQVYEKHLDTSVYR